jgi:two-component system sensor histidine kinase AlgZ
MKISSRSPNMRNLGINLRILVIVNIALALAAMVLSTSVMDFSANITAISTLAQPLLLLSLLFLYACHPLIIKLDYWQGVVAVVVIIIFACLSMHAPMAQLLIFSEDNSLQAVLRTMFFALLVTALTLYYFNLLQRAHSPAMIEARLQALQARIRPHFLFNSINAVLSLIRSQPRQAETALEDMAALFRVLMADNRDLVPLTQEVTLCRQYLSLEKLRLEERLLIHWQIDHMLPEALIPPLILQPLLENVVHHGIEPLANGGIIAIHIYCKAKEIHIVLKNPYNDQITHNNGNQIALKNIKERLALHFDLEASLTNTKSSTEYQVHITLPQQSYAR